MTQKLESTFEGSGEVKAKKKSDDVHFKDRNRLHRERQIGDDNGL